MSQRLDQFVTSNTVISRRKFLVLLAAGKVQVNNIVSTSMGMMINPTQDIVEIEGRSIQNHETLFYYKFNKPRNVITTMNDPNGRRCVADYMSKVPRQLVPIGRLDRNTTGLLLFSNDGQFCQEMAHPKFKIQKTYRVILDKALLPSDQTQLTRGFILEDGPVKVDQIIEEVSNEWIIVISMGKNRIIRRIFEFLGYEVKVLQRIGFGPILLGNLKEGEFTPLSNKELDAINNLFSFD